MINNISFNGIFNIQNNNKISFRAKSLPNDTFEKSSSPLKDNEFIKWAKENNFLSCGIKASLVDENLLGKGFSHSVYKIPNNDDYVLRVSRNYFDPKEVDFSQYKIKDTEDKSLKSNFGQEVAKIEADDFRMPSISVLRKQTGTSNGNPPPSAIHYENGELREGELRYEAIERKEHYANSLQFLADAPIEAYDSLMDKFSELDEAGYKFDYYNPNNFLLDKEKGTIEIIDLDKMSKPYENDLGNALWALTNIEYLNTYLTDSYNENDPKISDEDKNRAIKNTLNVIDKYTKAMQKKGKKFSQNGYEFTVHLLGSFPMSIFLQTNSQSEKIEKLRNMGLID